jgi:phosphatidylethanolamine/phosphatidyl-N-methylethanolamine N-methyltransferase
MAQPHESRVYSDLAHLYDHVFGRVFVDHEHEVIEELGFRPGQRALEVGVGTGISLDAYPPYIHLTGIDPSASMLAQAVAKTRENNWGHIDLRNGDAQALEFPDNSFDWVLSFHVMTVVPDPRRMMSEMIRVCKPGGRIVVISHFASANPFFYFFGRVVNPLARKLGWTTRLRARDVLDGQPITVDRNERFSPFAVHYCVMARKEA